MEYTAWGVVYTSSAEDFRVGKNMIWTEFRESKLFNIVGEFFKSLHFFILCHEMISAREKVQVLGKIELCESYWRINRTLSSNHQAVSRAVFPSLVQLVKVTQNQCGGKTRLAWEIPTKLACVYCNHCSKHSPLTLPFGLRSLLRLSSVFYELSVLEVGGGVISMLPFYWLDEGLLVVLFFNEVLLSFFESVSPLEVHSSDLQMQLFLCPKYLWSVVGVYRKLF
ncbi:unnamed protein product [Enterobius vermicularis]|uniref:Ovule protein n=1 Tax=Enterobius vermicularis TaxID=51028 RepID=A0A0N4UYD2_ENTVE|nr:unnamed protein product [Enterobius vermicularis]